MSAEVADELLAWVKADLLCPPTSTKQIQQEFTEITHFIFINSFNRDIMPIAYLETLFPIYKTLTLELKEVQSHIYYLGIVGKKLLITKFLLLYSNWILKKSLERNRRCQPTCFY